MKTAENTPINETTPHSEISIVTEKLLKELTELQQQEETVREKLEQYDKWAANIALTYLSDDTLKELYIPLIKMVEEDTHLFECYKELGIFEPIFKEFLELNYIGDVKIQTDRRLPSLGRYDVLQRVIMLPEEPLHGQNLSMRQRDIVRMLAIHGEPPVDVQTITHEFLHSLHSPKGKTQIQRLVECFFLTLRKYWWSCSEKSLRNDKTDGKFDRMISNEPLEEAYATFSQHDTETFAADREVTPQGQIENFVQETRDARYPSGEPGYSGATEEKLRYAATAINQLLALDVPHSKIGQIVKSHGKWNEQEQCYPNVRDFIEYTAKKNGLGKGESLWNNLELLVEKTEKQRIIDRLKTMVIVRKTIMNATNKTTDEKAY